MEAVLPLPEASIEALFGGLEVFEDAEDHVSSFGTVSGPFSTSFLHDGNVKSMCISHYGMQVYLRLCTQMYLPTENRHVEPWRARCDAGSLVIMYLVLRAEGTG